VKNRAVSISLAPGFSRSSADFQIGCIVGFQPAGRTTPDNLPIANRRYSRFGNLRYELPRTSTPF
jgi:hypothetical protein